MMRPRPGQGGYRGLFRALLLAPVIVAAIITGGFTLPAAGGMAVSGEPVQALALLWLIGMPIALFGLPVAYLAEAALVLFAHMAGVDLHTARKGPVILSAALAGFAAAWCFWWLADGGAMWPWTFGALPVAACGGWAFVRIRDADSRELLNAPH